MRRHATFAPSMTVPVVGSGGSYGVLVPWLCMEVTHRTVLKIVVLAQKLHTRGMITDAITHAMTFIGSPMRMKSLNL